MCNKQNKQFVIIMLSIVIGFGVVSIVCADPVRSDHPRVLLTPELLGTLRALIDNDTAKQAEWQELKSFCDTDIGNNPSYYSYWINRVARYGLAYNVVKESDPALADQYAGEALKYMKALARDWKYIGDGGAGGPSSGILIDTDNGYPIRFRGVYLAIGYDWLHDYTGFTPELKQEFYDVLNQWLDWYASEGYHRNGPGHSNYFLGYFAARALTAYSTYGDNPRAQEHIDGARTFFNTLVLPDLNEGREGGDHGAWNYGALAVIHVLYYLDALGTSTGEDLRDEFQFGKDVVFFKTHALKPNRQKVYEGGPWSGNTVGRPSYNDMMYLAYTYKDYKISRYIQYYINEVKPYAYHVPELWQALIWSDNSIPAEDCRPMQPLSYFAPGTGQVIMRSSWGEDAIWATFRVGESGMDDHDLDHGHFQIYKHDDLAIDAGMWNRDGIRTFNGRSIWHNTILIDEKGEGTLVYPPGQGIFHWTDKSKIVMTAFEDPGEYVYAVGQFGQAYRDSSGIDAIDRTNGGISRQFVYLRPDTFVVFDRISGKLRDYYTSIWRMHFAKEPAITGDTVNGIYNGGKLFHKVLLPTERTISIESMLPDNLPNSTYYVDVKTTTLSYNDIFLNVLYATDAGTTSMPPVTPIEGTTLIGSQVEDWVAMFSRTEPVGGRLEGGQFDITGLGTYNTIIADLIPNTNYNVSIDGTPLGTYTATNSGLLAFDLPLTGSHSVTINSGPPDNIAPATITDLEASMGAQPGSVDLTWTATGDDGNVGTATSYIIRYSTLAITSANWDSASDVDGEPSPQPAGTAETFTVTGLTAGQTYYFAIRAQDEAGNISNISNTTITPLKGDVNGDGLVNVIDVQLAVNQFLGVASQTDEADLNGDGVVNVIDVQLIVNIILGG